MASLITGTAFGNTNTRIAFSNILHMETVSKLYFNRRGLIASDRGMEDPFKSQASAPIRSVEALNNRRAQEVRIGMLNQLTTNRSAVTGARTPNARTYGSATANLMVDQEETAAIRSCIVYVEQSKHATSTVTREIQDLRTEFKLTAQLGGLLSNWMAQEDDENFLDALYDQYSGHVVAGVSSASAADPPVLNQKFAGGAADELALGTTNRLTPGELRRMWGALETGPRGTDRINPVERDGEECYVLLVHPLNLVDLQGNTEWQTLYGRGWERGKGNPIFGMAEAKYMNIYIHSYARIRAASGAPNVRMCLLLGANAAAHGMTVRPRLVVRREDDYEDIYGVGIKSIHGEARFDWAPTSGTTINQGMYTWGVYTGEAA